MGRKSEMLEKPLPLLTNKDKHSRSAGAQGTLHGKGMTGEAVLAVTRAETQAAAPTSAHTWSLRATHCPSVDSNPNEHCYTGLC